MKNLRIACFTLSFIQLGLFIRNLFLVTQQKTPETVNQTKVYSALILGYGLTIIIIILVVILAGKLNRSKIGWGIFSLLLPWAAGIIIAFLKEAEYKPKINYGYTGPSYSGSTYVSQKTCSACGRSVSLSATAGQRCPHCGVYWSTERRMN